jgi:hypothetical protein
VAWREKIDKTAQALLEPISDEKCAALGGVSVEGCVAFESCVYIPSAVDEYLAKHMQLVDSLKHRCKVGQCTKLFKGEEFLRKHIQNKHGHVLKHLETKLSLWNAFLRDPFRQMDEPQEDRPAVVRDQTSSRPRKDSRSDSRYTPYSRPSGGRPQTTTGGRALRSYVDLDAPTGSLPGDDISYD